MSDADAGFAAFVAAHEDRLVRSLVSETTLPASAAAEVVDEVLPVAYERRFATDGAAYGWLRVAARHHAAGSPAWSDAADAALVQAHLAAAALSRLPAADRDLLRLRFVDGLLPAAVAERLGVSVPEVLARLDRASAAAARALPAHDRQTSPIPLPRVAAAVILVVAAVFVGGRGGSPLVPPVAAAPVPTYTDAVPTGSTPDVEVPARSGPVAVAIRARAHAGDASVVVPVGEPERIDQDGSPGCRRCPPRRLADELHVKLPTEVGDRVGRRELVVPQAAGNEHVALCATVPAMPEGPASCRPAED